jgi:hypothetical protein
LRNSRAGVREHREQIIPLEAEDQMMARFDQPIEPMTLGNVRELGVRSFHVCS